jgi:predicted kinase
MAIARPINQVRALVRAGASVTLDAKDFTAAELRSIARNLAEGSRLTIESSDVLAAGDTVSIPKAAETGHILFT